MATPEDFAQLQRLQDKIQQDTQAYGHDGKPDHLRAVVESQQGIIAILIGLIRQPAMAQEGQNVVKLQQEMLQRQRMFQTLSSLLKQQQSAQQSILRNMR